MNSFPQFSREFSKINKRAPLICHKPFGQGISLNVGLVMARLDLDPEDILTLITRENRLAT
jgi:hypothetical protein